MAYAPNKLNTKFGLSILGQQSTFSVSSCAKLISNISKWNFGIWILKQFGTTSRVAFFLNWRGPLSNVVIKNLIEKSRDTISAQVVTLIPGTVVWALLFFLMLISLALGSIFAAFETILAALSDQWPQLRYYTLFGGLLGSLQLLLRPGI